MESSPSDALDRLLRQQLVSLSSAGVTHLARGRRASAVVEADSLPPASAVNPETMPRKTSKPESSPAKTEAPRSAAAAGELAAATGLAPPPAIALNRDERVTQLRILADKVASCTRCAELASTRQKTVFGVGNPETKIVFIGEAPGADEDRQGEPFVGRAGQLLTKIIEACKLRREDVYICNILKCRPPENRAPLPDECANCREYLDGQLAIIDPDYIVCWGSVAAKNLLGVEHPIGKMRGRFYQHGRAKVLCTYHPSYLLRNPPAKKDVWEDMKFFFNDMGVKLA